MQPDSLTIAAPVFNEQRALPHTAAACLAQLDDLNCEHSELLIVNDGSTDRTADAIADLAQRDPRVRSVSHTRNLGFAGAQKTCWREARGDWIFLLPGDGQIAPHEIRKFLDRADGCDLLLGVAQAGAEQGGRALQSRAYHALADALFGLRLGDFGACAMARRALVQSLEMKSRTPVLMTELAVRARARGARVCAVPVAKTPREHGTARGGRMLPHAPAILADLFSLYAEMKWRKSGAHSGGGEC